MHSMDEARLISLDMYYMDYEHFDIKLYNNCTKLSVTCTDFVDNEQYSLPSKNRAYARRNKDKTDDMHDSPNTT